MLWQDPDHPHCVFVGIWQIVDVQENDQESRLCSAVYPKDIKALLGAALPSLWVPWSLRISFSLFRKSPSVTKGRPLPLHSCLGELHVVGMLSTFVSFVVTGCYSVQSSAVIAILLKKITCRWKKSKVVILWITTNSKVRLSGTGRSIISAWGNLTVSIS